MNNQIYIEQRLSGVYGRSLTLILGLVTLPAHLKTVYDLYEVSDILYDTVHISNTGRSKEYIKLVEALIKMSYTADFCPSVALSYAMRTLSSLIQLIYTFEEATWVGVSSDSGNRGDNDDFIDISDATRYGGIFDNQESVRRINFFRSEGNE